MVQGPYEIDLALGSRIPGGCRRGTAYVDPARKRSTFGAVNNLYE